MRSKRCRFSKVSVIISCFSWISIDFYYSGNKCSGSQYLYNNQSEHFHDIKEKFQHRHRLYSFNTWEPYCICNIAIPWLTALEIFSNWRYWDGSEPLLPRNEMRSLVLPNSALLRNHYLIFLPPSPILIKYTNIYQEFLVWDETLENLSIYAWGHNCSIIAFAEAFEPFG